MLTNEVHSCLICESLALSRVIELPGLPLTGLFSKEPGRKRPGVDQELLLCTKCGHAQLRYQLPSEQLYGQDYSFRTSSSQTARHGTEWFLGILDKIAPARRFSFAVDIGCNDLFLLKHLKGRAMRRLGIDTVWSSAGITLVEGIEVSGSTAENAEINGQPDLIICRHTMEHLHEPVKVIDKLFNIAAKEALFLLEVPNFEALVERLRFDQVFHQHAQYFSRASLITLINRLDGRFLDFAENYHDWGAIIVAFSNRRAAKVPEASPLQERVVRQKYEVFKRTLSVAREVIDQYAETPLYGYGAAQMLPVLDYHLGSVVSKLKSVLDDDPAKDGIYYANLPLVIKNPSRISDIEESSVLITATDNVKPILARLMERRPRHIIYPLPVI